MPLRLYSALLLALLLPALAPAQTAPPAASPPPPAPAPETIIYPKNTAPAAPVTRENDGSRSLILLVALALAAGGAWLLVQRRKNALPGSRARRKLQIDETKPLGNRQYLVVADYDGKKFLLGVTPGQIQMLTPLETEPEKPEPGL